MLEIEHLVTGYGGVPVLQDVSIKLAAGELVGLLGANNAGKTTLINSLSGIYPPMSGRILFEGKDVTRLTARQRVEIGIVQVPEGRLVFPEMSIRENLLLGGINARARAHRARQMEHVLELFPRLSERLGQNAGTLSGGEQQMLAIGRAMMARPKMILMDEPSMGLSPLLVKEVFAIIRQINRDLGVTILLVEQNARAALSVASHGYIMEQGKVVLDGTADELRDNEDVKEFYLGGAGDQRKSFKNLKSFKRRKRWL